jgi:signal transduction histidine kinase
MSQPLHNSLRLRLIVGSALGVILAVLLAGLFIGYLYRSHTTDRFQTELDHHLDELTALIEFDPEERPIVRQPLSDPQFNVGRSGLYWQVGGPRGTAASPSLADGLRLVPAPDEAWHRGRAGEEEVLQRSARVTREGQPLTVTIASAQHLLEEQVDHFRLDLTLSMTVVGLLLLGGAALLVRFGLAPVRRLGEEVDRLRNGEIERLDPHVPAEFAAVVTRFNALLEGQAQLIARARTESGNLAHNLRTPLALIADEAEQLEIAGQTQSAAFLMERCRTMQRQIDYHLARAAAAGTRGAGTRTAVAPLLSRIVEAMQRLHADRGIRVVIDLPDDLRLPCDSGDLAEILSNVIDNAFKWARTTVTVTGDANRVTIVDDGPGIPAAQRALVTNIGTRLDAATPGTGLGLAATADLLRFYDAELVLDDAPGGGLRVTLKF